MNAQPDQRRDGCHDSHLQQHPRPLRRAGGMARIVRIQGVAHGGSTAKKRADHTRQVDDDAGDPIYEKAERAQLLPIIDDADF